MGNSEMVQQMIQWIVYLSNG